MKTCSKCGVLKAFTEFYSRSTTKDGLLGQCKLCCSLYHKEQRRNFPERILSLNLKSVLKYQARHPGKIKIQARKRSLERRYGLSLSDFEMLSNHQAGKCAICEMFPSSGRLVVDHCHTTNVVRGLLCNTCNIGLGAFKESLFNLSKAAEYLKGPA